MKHIFYVMLCAFLAVAASCKPKAHCDVDRTKYPLMGIDVSAHNGDIDFQQVAADSISFVYIKASEGTDFCDAMFARNYSNAQEAGLATSAYHFFRFDEPGHLQAYNFLHAISGLQTDMPVMVDVEDWQNADGIPEDEIIEQLGHYLRVMHEAGYDNVIYTNKSGYEKYIADNFPGVAHLWICSFSPISSDIDWKLWQHSHQGKVAGIKGNVDLDTFNGSQSDFDAWRMYGSK